MQENNVIAKDPEKIVKSLRTKRYYALYKGSMLSKGVFMAVYLQTGKLTIIENEEYFNKNFEVVQEF